jgi:hypothetical protein
MFSDFGLKYKSFGHFILHLVRFNELALISENSIFCLQL